MEPHGLFVVPLSDIGTVFEVVGAVVLATIVVLVCWWLDHLRRRSRR